MPINNGPSGSKVIGGIVGGSIGGILLVLVVLSCAVILLCRWCRCRFTSKGTEKSMHIVTCGHTVHVLCIYCM